MSNYITYDELNDALEKAGAPTNYYHFSWDEKPLDPLSALLNGPFDIEPYFDILLEFAPRMSSENQVYIARAFTKKGAKKAVPFLLSLFEKYDANDNMDLWGVGNALSVIDDKSTYPDILKICQDKTKGNARQMLMGTLARMKTKEAYQVLLDSLEDETVRAHAIDGLGRFGNVDAIPIIESLVVEKSLYEFKAKNTALRRLNRKMEKHRGE